MRWDRRPAGLPWLMHPVSCSRSNIWQAESIEVVAFAHAHLFAVVRVLVVVTDKVQQPEDRRDAGPTNLITSPTAIHSPHIASARFR